MAKFTDTQLIVLSSAAARDDGIAVVPAKMNGAAASKLGASLVKRKLMREVGSKPGMPVWRKGEDDRPISLMIMRPGRDALGVEEDVTAQALRASNKPLRGRKLRSSKSDHGTLLATKTRLTAAQRRRAPGRSRRW
jgi:hypothetical protein